MNITLSLNDEHAEAIAKRALENEPAATCVTRHAQAMVDGWVQADIVASGTNAVQACLSLPQADRDEILALIAQKVAANAGGGQ